MLEAKNLCTITVNNIRCYFYRCIQKLGNSLEMITLLTVGYLCRCIRSNLRTLKFRTGDRTLRFIDNNTNNIEIGVHTTKAEDISRNRYQ